MLYISTLRLMSEIKALLVGESWQSLQIDIKGFDIFPRSTYHESITPLQNALEDGGVETNYISTNTAARDFPSTADELTEYDVVVLSDVGYNTIAIPPATFDDFEQVPNRIQLIEDYVRAGGGLVMVGGYLSYQGFNAKANYKGTAIENALPVTLQSYDDRVERSDGVTPETVDAKHDILTNVSEEWPHLLGYNRVSVDDDASELVQVDDDPLLVIGEHGGGRTAAFTSDCAPHWGPPEFTEWSGYQNLWTNLIEWTANE